MHRMLLVALAALPLVAGGQAPRTQSPAIPLDPAVRRGKLPNGLTFYIRRNARPEHRVELRLVVNAGSVLEDEDQRGMAHFVEHMLFNGTRRFKKNDLVSYLESIGVRFGADLNAYTGFDETVYILPVPTDKPGLVGRAFDVLEDWASGALFDSTEVIAERGVVLDEWRRGLGASSRIRDQQFPVIFHGSRYATRLPIGTSESIEGATPGPLKRFYRDWYRPDLMAIIAVGDIEPAIIERLIRSRFTKLRGPAHPRARLLATVPGNDSTLVTIATDREQQLSTALLLYKHRPQQLRTRADYRALMVRQLYNNMLNDRFGEIIRRPNAPFTGASSAYGNFVRASDVYQLAAGVRDGGVADGVRALLAEARRVDVHGFLPAELARAKTALLRDLESANAERDKSESDGFAGEYINHYLSGEPSPGIAYEYAAAQALLPGVTLADVNSLGRGWITETNRVVAVSAPDSGKSQLPDDRALFALFRAADTATVAPWTESVIDAPLVAALPAPGRVVSERVIASLNVTDWRLSNGVRVLVKPTDFKADEVVMRAWSPGGASLADDSDFASAALATLAAERGGVGAFDAIALAKKLVGKQVQVAPVIDNLSEGFGGAASPKDIETMLQLIYLKVTAPRADSAAFDAVKAQIAPFLANRANSPEAVFSDTVLVTLAQHHPRARPVNAELLREVTFSRAFAVYRDRFADAGDFTFVFVGAVQPAILKPLVERWLGALPNIQRKETWRDVGIRSPAGTLERIVYKGQEPKAETVLYFDGDVEFSPANRHAIRSLSETLEMKLLETLREALGGTYSVSVNGGASRLPRPEYSISITFGSSPARADSLTKAVLMVIDSLATTGPSASDIQKIMETQTRTLEVSEKENSYWLTNLSARVENGEDAEGLLRYRDFINGLTPDQVRDAARRFLDPLRMKRFVLMPEKTGS